MTCFFPPRSCSWFHAATMVYLLWHQSAVGLHVTFELDPAIAPPFFTPILPDGDQMYEREVFLSYPVKIVIILVSSFCLNLTQLCLCCLSTVWMVWELEASAIFSRRREEWACRHYGSGPFQPGKRYFAASASWFKVFRTVQRSSWWTVLYLEQLCNNV